MEKKGKYTMDSLRGFSGEARLAEIGVMIANELHNIYSVLWEIKERKK